MRSLVFLALLALGCHRVAAGAEPVDFYTGGAKPGDAVPVIIALHGYGGRPERIVRMLDGFALRAHVIAPRGIHTAGHGWGWVSIRIEHSTDELAPGITEAADAVLRVVAERTRGQATCGRPIVVGFSQGGFLSYALAARSPAVVAAAFPIGGLLSPSLRPTKAPKDAPRVLAFHGEADETVDLEEDRRTYAAFEQAGYAGKLHTYPGVQHVIAPEIVRDVQEEIARAIRDEGCAR